MGQSPALDEILLKVSGILFPDLEPRVVAVNTRNSDGDTPLHVVSQWGDAQAAQQLLDAGALADTAGDMGATPLYYAVMNGHAQVARVLLHHGADPTKMTELNFSPLSLAQRNGDAEMISLLSR